jgi:hypothetical protein
MNKSNTDGRTQNGRFTKLKRASSPIGTGLLVAVEEKDELEVHLLAHRLVPPQKVVFVPELKIVCSYKISFNVMSWLNFQL